jgi:hypothetical protein
MLRAVPVKSPEVQSKDPLELGLIAGRGDKLSEHRIGIERHRLDVPADLEAGLSAVVHQDQRGTVISRKVAEMY